MNGIEWVGVVIIALMVGAMIRMDIRADREAREYWEHSKATRHCLARPYKGKA